MNAVKTAYVNAKINLKGADQIYTEMESKFDYLIEQDRYEEYDNATRHIPSIRNEMAALIEAENELIEWAFNFVRQYLFIDEIAEIAYLKAQWDTGKLNGKYRAKMIYAAMKLAN